MIKREKRLFRQPFSVISFFISFMPGNDIAFRCGLSVFLDIRWLDRMSLFIFFNDSIFNKDVFWCVGWDHLPRYYIAVTFHLAEGLYGFWGKSSCFTSGIFGHFSQVVSHVPDKVICDRIDIRSIFHSGQFVLSDFIIQISKGTL